MTDAPEHDPHEPETDAPSPSKLPAIIGLALVAALAIGPKLAGFGWFGARFLFSAEVPIYALNLSGQDVTVELSFSSDTTLAAGTLEVLETLAGPITLVARDADGTVVDELSIDAQGPLFYNVAGADCLAVFDLTSFYGPQQRSAVTLHARIEQGTRLYPIDAETVVLPRRTNPDSTHGDVHWIESVSCSSLDPDRENELLMWAESRFMERRRQLEEAREAAGQ